MRRKFGPLESAARRMLGGFWNAADHPVDTCAQSLVLLIFQLQESSPFTAKEQFSSKLVVHLEGMLGVSKAD